MGINKQLDFQVFLTMFGRGLARHQGWLEHRRTVQCIFAITAIACASISGLLFIFRIRRIIKDSIIELTGVSILAFYAAIRVGSMNHLSSAVSFEKSVFSRVHGIELAGLIVILFAVFVHVRNLSRRHT